MLIKLLPKQVTKFWSYIRVGLLNVPSPIMASSPQAFRNILRSLLIGESICWAVKKDVESDIYGFVITNIMIDPISLSKTLNIYSVYAFKQFTPTMMNTSIETLVNFARINGCSKLTAYSNIDKLITVAKEFNFTIETRFLVREV